MLNMTENNTEEKFFSLTEFCQNINEAISTKFGRASYWIQAEIANFKMTGGHCYLKLIEKEMGTTEAKAKIDGRIWSSNFLMLNKKFKSVTGSDLQESIKILFSATVEYHRTYGITVNITDIKPEFTLGSLLQERNQIIKKLKDDGEYFLNKKKLFPLVPQRIAVISAKDSKGFEDFETKLYSNRHKYKYALSLFPALLQGEKAASDIKSKLLEIYKNIGSYDIVVIVRGGGGSVNLNCFNNYKLSRTVARFPIPVITGIGHTSNISVVDEVAYLNKITPTDVADFIVEQSYSFEKNIQRKFKEIIAGYDKVRIFKINEVRNHAMHLNHLNKILNIGKLNILFDLRSKISRETVSLLKQKSLNISHGKSAIDRISNNFISEKFSELRRQAVKTGSYSGFRLKSAEENLSNLYKTMISVSKNLFKSETLLLKSKSDKVNFLDPQNILKRGYSITLKNGKSLNNVKGLNADDKVTTILFEGEFESKIINTKK